MEESMILYRYRSTLESTETELSARELTIETPKISVSPSSYLIDWIGISKGPVDINAVFSLPHMFNLVKEKRNVHR